MLKIPPVRLEERVEALERRVERLERLIEEVIGDGVNKSGDSA